MPYWRTTIAIPLSRDEAETRLRALIGPEPGFRDSLVRSLSGETPDRPFTGIENGGTFTLRRIVNYRNNMLPVVLVGVGSAAGGTALHVRMRMSAYGMFFMILWLGFLLSAIVRNFEPWSLGLLAFMAAIFGVPFAFEVTRTLKILRAAVGAPQTT